MQRETLDVRIRLADGVLKRQVAWALGLLSSGEAEALGVWPDPRLECGVVDEIDRNLKERGVEAVDFVSIPAQLELSTTLHNGKRHALHISMMGTLTRDCLSDAPLRQVADAAETLHRLRNVHSDRQSQAALAELSQTWGSKCPLVDRLTAATAELGSFFALPLRTRQMLLSGEDLAQELHEHCQRAIRRHGSFDSLDSAVSFVARTLERVEHRVAARVHRMDGFSGRVAGYAGSGSRSGAAGL